MKYCSRCGETNLDQAKFCKKCGNPLEYSNVGGYNPPTTPPAYNPPTPPPGYDPTTTITEPEQPKKKNTATIIIFVALGVCVVAIAVILMSVFGVFGEDGLFSLNSETKNEETEKENSDGEFEIKKSDYKSTIESYFKATASGDMDTVLDCVFPRSLQNAAFKEAGTTRNEVIAEADDDFDYDIEIKKIEFDDEDDLDTYEIEEIQDLFDEITDELGINKLKIQDAKEVEVEITAKVDGVTDTESDTMRVIKIDGKWYVYVGTYLLNYY